MRTNGFSLHRLAATTSALYLAGLAGGVQAHDGHGPSGSHWHASDAVGFGIALLAAVALVWWTRRK